MIIQSLGNNIRGYVYVCSHCGEYLKSKRLYCEHCNTKAQRDKMDKENAEFFGETLEVYLLKTKLSRNTRTNAEKTQWTADNWKAKEALC